MKKLMLFLICLIVISCSLDDEKGYESLDYVKIDQVLAMQGKMQRLAYSSLSASEKYYVWITRLNEVQKTTINNEQTIILNNLRNHLSINYFNNLEIRESKEQSFSLLKTRVVEQFGADLAKKYFTTLDEIGSSNVNKTDTGIVPPDGGDRQCTCNSSDDWCIYGSSCFAGFCLQTNSGCGWWLEGPCNGTCVSNP
jgi:hypothetical protein